MHIHRKNSVPLRALRACAAAGVSLAALGVGAANALTTDDQSLLGLDEIVVVGTPGGAGVRKQDASFALTTLNADDIDRFNPMSTADLLKSIPGVWAESSGGESGANIFVRGYPGGGDAEFVTLQLNGAPIFHPSTLSFLENTQLFRVDETIRSVEGVRGGPASVFSNGQPGLTVNFTQKTGGDEFEGLLQASGTDFGEIRADAVISGPLAEDTYFMIGGFYRSSDGVRDSEFRSEHGGQISANLVKESDRGSFMIYGRYMNDFGAWLLPIPVIQNGEDISEFPGFNIKHGTYHSDDIRYATLPDGSAFDGRDGRGANLFHVGGNLDFDLGNGFTITNKISFMTGDADTIGYVGNSDPMSAIDYAAGFGGGVSALTVLSSGESLADTTQVMELGLWRVEKDIENLSNEFSISKSLGPHDFVFGVYGAKYSSHDLWTLGNATLVTAESNARRLDIELDNGAQVSNNGFVGSSFFNQNSMYDGRDIALYFSDTWQITDRLRFDGGVRWQDSKVTGTLENNDFGVDLDGDPDTLYDNNTAVLNGTFATIDHSDDDIAWSLGLNLDVTSTVGVFARASAGNRYPFFDNLREGLDTTQRVRSYEGGIKVSTDRVGVFATLFYADFRGLESTQIDGGGNIVPFTGDASSFGVEFETVVEPIDNFVLQVTGTYLDATYDNFFINNGADDASGNRIQRQPRWQVRAAPSYTVYFGPDSSASIFGAVTYVGDRFSDVANEQLLPSYTKLDAGLILNLGRNVTFAVNGDNLTNSVGLTEGNPRVIGSQGQGVILARPILGRSVRFKLGYAF